MATRSEEAGSREDLCDLRRTADNVVLLWSLGSDRGVGPARNDDTITTISIWSATAIAIGPVSRVTRRTSSYAWPMLRFMMNGKHATAVQLTTLGWYEFACQRLSPATPSIPRRCYYTNPIASKRSTNAYRGHDQSKPSPVVRRLVPASTTKPTFGAVRGCSWR